MRLLAAALFAGTAAGAAYTAFAIARVRNFRARRETNAGFEPAVTVFKPLHGTEPDLYANLRSFCDQEYGEYQLIFGAADANDPALQTARRIQREFPQRDIAIAAGAAMKARNPKIGNLLGMRGSAKHEFFLIADSDMRVGPDYLRSVMGAFADPEVGAVTCLYGGTSGSSAASQLGAMHVNDQFSPSVLVATAIEPLTYCFGATMAVRRSLLETAGGFEALGEHIGDDYALGGLVSRAGRRVELAPYVVHTTVAEDRLSDLWLHELRWARTVLAQRPAGYAGSVITYALPLAAALFALGPSPLSASALALVSTLRIALHYEARRTFAPHIAASPWLIPLRDLLGISVWCAAFFGKAVRWRGEQYSIEAGGHMAAGGEEL